MRRLLIGATGSNVGKTTLVCGLLQVFKNRGLNPCAFKCGPDYLDPLFHRQVVQVPSHNLDLFFSTPKECRALLNHYSNGHGISLLEGVMGYYDGLGATSKASSWQVAVETQTPCILLVNPQGMGASLAAIVKGFLQYQNPHNIAGILFNPGTKSQYEMGKKLLKPLKIPLLGYLPYNKDYRIESVKGGLDAGQIKGFQAVIEGLGRELEKTVDIDQLLQIAHKAPKLSEEWVEPLKLGKGIKIGLAQDKAFSYYYKENLDILSALGAEVVPVSPLNDAVLPPLDGLIIGGGDLVPYVEALSKNTTFLHSLQKAHCKGLALYAEGAGYAYLHEQMKLDRLYTMAGVVKGAASATEKLGNFGYFSTPTGVEVFASEEKIRLKGHEFHYWESSGPQGEFTAQKPIGGKSWPFGISSQSTFIGFPYFYFPGNIGLAQAFVLACKKYQKERMKNATVEH